MVTHEQHNIVDFHSNVKVLTHFGVKIRYLFGIYIIRTYTELGRKIIILLHLFDQTAHAR